ncbi:LAMI_0F13960g1_1 [Lachancea mirantina]|uniref:LAMI_0F13960g1_1 n=1 Tax=Lachancea mirantina TaxID=1230905 RepID=A0A1G4K3Y4_9SACH|nr:LAMI_0F13960g1_1 [Lachancea mirantina]
MTSQSHDTFQYINAPSQLADLISNTSVVTQDIEFVSVLTSIDFNPVSRCIFRFGNFENSGSNGQSDHDYNCKILCQTPDTLNLTKMTLSLFSQQFDLELPDSKDETGFCIDGIYLERLCFVHCKGKFVTSKGKGSIFLQGLRAVDLHATLFTTGSVVESQLMKTVAHIFDQLVILNNVARAPFKFVKLFNYDNEMKQFIQTRQEKLLIGRRNPLFGAVASAVDSQDDFNSLAVESQFLIEPELDVPMKLPKDAFLNTPQLTQTVEEPFYSYAERDSNPIPVFEAQLDPFHGTNSQNTQQSTASTIDDRMLEGYAPDTEAHDCDEGEAAATKRRQFTSITAHRSGEFKIIGATSSDELIALDGTFVAILPNETGDAEACAIALFVPSHYLASHPFDKVINPYKNCYQVVIHRRHHTLRDLKIEPLAKSAELITRLREILLDKIVHITVAKDTLRLEANYFTFAWALRSLRFLEQRQPLPPTRLPSKRSNKNEDKDPLKTLSEISVSLAGQTEFIRTFALLVGAKERGGGKMWKFVFTDFTSHRLNGQSAFDSFIGNYDNRLEQDRAFVFIMYRDTLRRFSAALLNKLGCRFEDLFTGNDHNLTYRGIVCRLCIKAKLYNGSLDGIIRECEPVRYMDPIEADEVPFLVQFYTRCLQNVPEHILAANFNNYREFWPFQMNKDRVSMSLRSQKGMQDLQIPELQQLNQLQAEMQAALPAIYDTTAKIVAIHATKETLVFHLTNDLLSCDLLDPARTLKVAIRGKDKVENFLANTTSAKLDQLQNKVVQCQLTTWLEPVTCSHRLLVNWTFPQGFALRTFLTQLGQPTVKQETSILLVEEE